MFIFLTTFLAFMIIFYVTYLTLLKNLWWRTNRNFLKIFNKNTQYVNGKKDIDKYVLGYTVVSMTTFFLSLYLLDNYILILSTLVVLGTCPYFLVKYLKNKRIKLFEKQLPDAIDLMSGSLLAGNSLTGAFALIAEEYPAPLSQEISIVVREQKLGISVDESLQNFVKRMPLNSIILTVSVIRTSIETGGELSNALKNVAHTLRSIDQAEGKIKALTAQGKMQAWVVGLMPIFLMLVLNKMEPEAMSKVWT